MIKFKGKKNIKVYAKKCLSKPLLEAVFVNFVFSGQHMTYTIQDNIAVVKFDQKDSKVGIQKLLASVYMFILIKIHFSSHFSSQPFLAGYFYVLHFFQFLSNYM